MVRWALEVAHIPPERILLLGQSLGTAVVTAVAERFVVDEAVEFKGIVLIAAFSDIPTLLSTYAVAGIIPIFSPLRPYPFLQRFFANHVQETWYTSKRLGNLVRRSRQIDLHLIHSKNDFDIPWTHSSALFNAAASGTSDEVLTSQKIDEIKFYEDLGGSGHRSTWRSVHEDGSTKSIKLDIVHYGGKAAELSLRWYQLIPKGHNRVPTYPVVGKAIFNIFFRKGFDVAEDLEQRTTG